MANRVGLPQTALTLSNLDLSNRMLGINSLDQTKYSCFLVTSSVWLLIVCSVRIRYTKLLFVLACQVFCLALDGADCQFACCEPYIPNLPFVLAC